MTVTSVLTDGLRITMEYALSRKTNLIVKVMKLTFKECVSRNQKIAKALIP